MKLPLPILIGFGISNHTTFGQVCNYLSGGIIGSAFVKAIENTEKPEEKIEGFVRMITKG